MGRKTHREGEALSNVVDQAGKKFMSFKHTHAGAADEIVFADLDLPNMRDTAYVIMLQGETTESLGDAFCVDESTIKTTGFTFKGGTAAEITHVLIHGYLEE
jgi:hypothetical protein